MNVETVLPSRSRRRRPRVPSWLWLLSFAVGLTTVATAANAQALGAGVPADSAGAEAALLPVWEWDPTDPRLSLEPGSDTYVGRGVELIAAMERPEGFATNTDLGFRGNYAYVGNYRGINIYDVSNPASPTLRLSLLCPGSQGDVSIYGNLLFKSDQATGARLDCGEEPPEGPVSPDRFRGVRIFDISDVDNPRQVAAVQACRGSHTHSLVTDPNDPAHVYVYIQGTSGVRPAEEMEGCTDAGPEDPSTSRFQIEVVRVPLAAPSEARIVSEPRVFADQVTGEIAGLRSHNRQGEPASAPSACHDITTYPAIGLAGGACSGNGLLLDIRDVVNPVRIDEVADRNFSYWHSATFNNDGTKVIFTDEWGGGGAPRCRDIDPPIWGGDAIFDIKDGKLIHRSYYKLPVPVAATCVAHNGSLIPVPGRDIKVQSWYQGGISIFDFTDSDNPVEIAFFQRSPGGGGSYWSSYWYNGYIYGTARTLDVLELVPSEYLTANEIEAAMAVVQEELNPQHQARVTWPAIPAVSLSYVDQLVRAEAIDAAVAARVSAEITAFAQASGSARNQAAERLTTTAAEFDAQALAALTAGRTDNPTRVRALLASSLRELAATR